MRKILMSVVVLSTVGLLVFPAVGCGKKQASDDATVVVADEVAATEEEVAEPVEGVSEEVSGEAAEVEQSDWQVMETEGKRGKINEAAEEALEELFAQNAKAKEIFAGSYGWAVFDNLKIGIGISGGGGNGVAVVKDTNERTYMKMGTAGVGLTLGAQKYQVVFLIQDSKTFDSFVNKGWQADAGASAVAGASGAGVMTDFVNGLAIYQLTEKGLMANADIAGTKYWKNKKLND
jgi:lipid-binding SYLF domain-containing protein